MKDYEASGDPERKTAIAADPLAKAIHDTINAKPHGVRLYPDLYAIEVADAVRAYLSARAVSDEAQAEAERRWPYDKDDDSEPVDTTGIAHDAFVDGAEWQASRNAQPVADEVKWEYLCRGDGYNRYVNTEAEAEKWRKRGYSVSKRTPAIEAGPWIEVQS